MKIKLRCILIQIKGQYQKSQRVCRIKTRRIKDGDGRKKTKKKCAIALGAIVVYPFVPGRSRGRKGMLATRLELVGMWAAFLPQPPTPRYQPKFMPQSGHRKPKRPREEKAVENSPCPVEPSHPICLPNIDSLELHWGSVRESGIP